ncbi:MAG: DNA repair protein RadA, partial [Neisseriaceae bacterium]|nr:DNA repair protein RadA [Neisseriaceae bacterium]
MAKVKTEYTCTACGGTSPKWQGKCDHCGEWNTLIEQAATSGANPRFATWTAQTTGVQNLADVKAQEV